MHELHLLFFLGFACQCAADNTFVYKSITRKRSTFSNVFQNVSSVISPIDCGRCCKEKQECLSASFCQSNCHLSNAAANNASDELEADENCIHMELTAVYRSKTEVAVSCPADYNRTGNLCLKYFEELTTHADANNTCFARGGHLVTVDSSHMMLTLLDMCRAMGCHHIWIDGKEGQTWDGNPLPFEKWYLGESLEADECPVICTNENEMKSSRCSEINQSYCQIDIV